MGWRDDPIADDPPSAAVPAPSWRDDPVSAPAEPPATRKPAEAVARQVGLAARAGIQGVGGLVGIVSDPIGAVINQLMPANGPKAQQARELARQLSDVLGLPQPETAAERVVGAATETLAGAGGTVGLARAAANAATAPVARGVAQAMAAQPVQQLAGAAGAGAAGQAAAEAGAGPAGQVAASLAGGITAAKLAPSGPRVRPPTPAVVAEAQQAGVPLMTSDVIEPKTFMGKLARATGERVPLAGTGGMRETQQAARVEAVKRVAQDYGADIKLNVDDAMAADLVKRRGEQLSKYIDLKKQAFMAAPQGPVAVPRAVAQIDRELSRIARLGDAVPPNVTKVLQDFRTSIQGKDVFDLDDVRKLLGEQLTAPELASARSVTEKIPSRVYGALRDDIGTHVQQAGMKEFNKWQVANARLSELAGEANNQRLRAALNAGTDTPEAVSSLLFSTKPSDVRRLFGALSEDGRRNARTAIISRALREASTGDEVSPTRFASQIERMGAQVGVFFPAKDRARLEGLARVLRATQRGADAAAAPPTGVQAMPFVGGALLADLFGSAGAATVTGGSIGLTARAYESQAVRDMLLRIRSVKPGAAEEAAIAKRVIAAIQQQQSSQDGQPPTD